jgi:very-short-patch-repair endonuclease
VWLHWDPRTVAERGPDALLRFRMDFLLLLPAGVRIVIEVDGRQHYADDLGSADPSRYGAMAAADRDLRLAGYEVFRFGANELVDETESRKTVKDFFDALFKKYGVVASP